VKLHPAAWLAWLGAICVFAFVVTNPLYVVLALAAMMVVDLSFPRDRSAVGRAVRTFMILGVVLLVVRLAFIGLLPNPGRTALFVLPDLRTPRWLGGLELGGAVSAEVLVAAAGEGLRLVVVLAAFGVFNARADTSALLRSVPAAFRDVGLVVSIAVGFVPGILRTVSEVRDAQRLRGEGGLRRIAPALVVPVLGLSLERALLLAESMDVRGYGRGVTNRAGRFFLGGGLGTVLVGVGAWAAGFREIGAAATACGAAAIVWGFRTASMAAPMTRLRGAPVTGVDIATIFASSVVVTTAIVAGSKMTYDPYPSIAWPAFAWPMAAVTVLFTVPALAGVSRP
jgi:energy-coupling factor transport system permease protein